MKPLTATDKWTPLNIFRQGARRLSLLQCGLSQVMSTCIIIAEQLRGFLLPIVFYRLGHSKVNCCFTK